ncbi:MAG: DNA topoisomerase 4 subunit A [Lachnospiraceae bacterium]|nr:DNA topoisomerase 4 subunit A [Lachnospiraceae bacterium]
MKQKERLLHTEYSDVMQKSYIDYAMSVIVARALPDVRDGLKPVQRRTLYDMSELGIRYDKPYRKCARIVGDTMGKYHPHGDSSIYDSLVVMAQDFKKGQTLVDGHGNFGSIEGDGAAAMRYTEARLTKFTQEAALADMDKDIIDFTPNFDETEKEPVVLPFRVPNLLINGAEGIAVGMATSIPTHNLREVIEGVKAYMADNSISTKELMKYIKGPDFPTGGIVANASELEEIYATGSGRIRIRGKVEIENAGSGRKRIVVTEIPYTMIGAGIGKFLNDVAALAETTAGSAITDISNQSSKEGIRIVIELKRGADLDYLQDLLYKKTRLEDTFGVNMLAVAEGRPKTLSLRQIIEHHIDFQFETTTRKYQYLLGKEKDNKEIQEGLIKACDVIDLIIEILRGSKTLAQAKKCLTDGDTKDIKFKSSVSKKMAAMLRFTQKQADAVLAMRLSKLVGLEVEALLARQEETLKKIAEYENILNDYDAMARVITDDLDSLAGEYGRERRTQIADVEEVVIKEKPVARQKLMFLMDRFGYVRTLDPGTYSRNEEAALAESKFICPCVNVGKICLFTDDGMMHQAKVSDIPRKKFRDKGIPIDNVSGFDSSTQRIIFVCDEEKLKDMKLYFLTENGMIKKVEGSEFIVTRYNIAATKLAEDDEVIHICPAHESEDVVIRTERGFFLRFDGSEVPDQKKNSMGVHGIRLKKGDKAFALYTFSQKDSNVGIEYGEGRLVLTRLKKAKRGGTGTLRDKGQISLPV